MRVRYGKPIKVISLVGQQNILKHSEGGNIAHVCFINNNSFMFDSQLPSTSSAKKISVISGHKYFCFVKLTFTPTGTDRFIFYKGDGTTNTDADSNACSVDNYYHYSINTCNNTSSMTHLNFYLNTYQAVTGDILFGGIIDLTSLFGSGKEPTAQEFYNKYNKYFPLIATGEEITIDDKAGQVSISRLPSEYQQVEYIESTGTQYIDTQVLCSSDLTIKIKYINNSYNTINDIFGNFVSEENSFRLFSYQDQLYLDYGSGYNTSNRHFISNYTTYDVLNYIEIGNGYVKNLSTNTDIITFTSVPSFTKSYNLLLTKSLVSGTSKNKIYSCQIYNNNTLVRKFIPCYRKSDNEIGMYDLVGKQFYTNQGTETFLKGNNVNNTTSCKVAGGSSDIYYGYNSIFDFSASIWTNDNADTFTMTKTADKLSFECHTAGSRNNKGITNNILVVAGHKYLLSYDILSTVSYNFDTSGNTVSPSTVINMYPTSLVANELTNVQMIVQAKNNLTWRMGRGSVTVAVGDTIEFSNIYIIDLTDWFGVGKEPSTVQEFNEKFTKEYYGFCKTPIKLTRYQIEALPNYGYNQVATIGNFTNRKTNGITYSSIPNESIIFNGTGSGGSNVYFDTSTSPYILDHKYLLKFMVDGTQTTQSNISMQYRVVIPVPAGTYNNQEFYQITKCTKDVSTGGCHTFCINNFGNTSQTYTNFKISNYIFIDLTDWYGAGSEPTTIEEFKATFPNKYYSYSKKRLLNKYMINKLIN